MFLVRLIGLAIILCLAVSVQAAPLLPDADTPTKGAWGDRGERGFVDMDWFRYTVTRAAR